MNRVLIVVAVVAFLLALVLVVTDSEERKLIEGLLFGGLASFAASFLPW